MTTDCAEGDFAPLRADRHGRFSAHGTYAAAAPGPQAADASGGAPATIAGSLSGNTMTVTITTAGIASEAHHLIRGRHVKLVRCLKRQSAIRHPCARASRRSPRDCVTATGSAAIANSAASETWSE